MGILFACMPGMHLGQKMVSNSQELELQVIVSDYVGPGK